MLRPDIGQWAAQCEEPPKVLSSAPCLVNLIGDQTDYNEGFALPVAIDLQVTVVAREAGDDHFVSVQVPDAVDHRGPGWRRYAHACRSALESRGLMVPFIHAVVESSVPGGSGLSSSAALELALLAAWNKIGNLGISPSELAEIAWVAENEYV